MVTTKKPTTLYDKARLAARENGIRGMSRKAREWYRQEIGVISGRMTPNRAMGLNKREDMPPQIGRMYFYLYDPKHKDKLKYYDIFPLTIVIKRYKDGFLGLNLHYLPPTARGMFLSKLMDVVTDPKLSESAKLKVTYDFLRSAARYKEFEPCLHRYLYSQMQSPPSRVEPQNWLMAIFLPVARFKKARNNRVWNDSIKRL